MDRPLQNTPLPALEEMRNAAAAMLESRHFDDDKAREALSEIDAEIAKR